MLVDAGDTRLHVVERGTGDLALIALHGGPGLDHTMFGHWLDPEGDEYRLLLVDERAQGRSVGRAAGHVDPRAARARRGRARGGAGTRALRRARPLLRRVHRPPA